MITLTGHVVSGLGDLSGWMRRYSDAYAQAVGVALEPGSLNVLLDEPWTMHHPDVRLEAEKAGVGLGLLRCRLNDQACWIVRTDKNNRGEGGHGLDVLEVVAAVHLRTVLQLSDGDDIAVVIDDRRERRP